jgi:hypothetical protein
VVGTGINIPFKSNSIDLALCTGVIEHVPKAYWPKFYSVLHESFHVKNITRDLFLADYLEYKFLTKIVASKFVNNFLLGRYFICKK